MLRFRQLRVLRKSERILRTGLSNWEVTLRIAEVTEAFLEV